MLWNICLPWQWLCINILWMLCLEKRKLSPWVFIHRRWTGSISEWYPYSFHIFGKTRSYCHEGTFSYIKITVGVVDLINFSPLSFSFFHFEMHVFYTNFSFARSWFISAVVLKILINLAVFVFSLAKNPE